jgi:hypothetical protein
MEASLSNEAVAPGKRRCVEIFGVHELVLKPNTKSGYKDVYPVKRKKHPWQAKVWDAARQSLVGLGSFATPQEAAVAVATARVSGLENLPSPDKSRASRGSGGELTACALLSILLHVSFSYGASCLLAGKRKLGATPLTSLTVPLVSSLFEPQNLPVAALFPLGAAERERAGAMQIPAAMAQPLATRTV